MSTENVKISYGLWFNGNAEEAMEFYKSVFGNATEIDRAHYVGAGQDKHHMEAGKLMSITMKLEDVTFQAINAGDEFKKNPSISFFINCKTTEEAQQYWDKLSDGGKVLMELDSYDWSPKYGWIEDKFDVSWQIYAAQEGYEIPQKINASLMFINKNHGRAEEAIKFYTSVFTNSTTEGIMKYPEGTPDAGKVMHAQFQLNGHTLMAMDSGMDHKFDFNSGESLIINCTTQEEIDYFWDKLIAGGGKEIECGWLEDKFGVSWQVSPVQLDKMMSDPDLEAVKRVTEEMLSQKKLDIAKLEKAFRGN